VLEGAPDAMVITSAAGVIELANSRTDTLFGYPRESLLGSNVRTLIPGWRCPELIDHPPRVTPPVETRLNAVRQDGSMFPAEITTSSFSAPESFLVTTAIRDATDQVDAENRINRINQELEKRVEDRTAELTRSNEALRQFAWAASHDLQEPIRTVLAYSQWLAESIANRLDDREATMLRFIEQHAARMHQLAGGLQQYIYVSESGQQSWTSVDLNETVKTAISTLQGIIEETDAVIECGPLPTLQSIELLMVQLFKNLISNGIKYRSDRRPHIQITAESSDDGWIFSVRDNGIGVDPKYFEYIFGVFRRLHGVDQSGTGIGLAICRAAVERLGGRIWVESTPGSGSAFRFFHPAVRKELGGEFVESSGTGMPEKQTA
jgi:PAS domain S-box-containing protein